MLVLIINQINLINGCQNEEKDLWGYIFGRSVLVLSHICPLGMGGLQGCIFLTYLPLNFIWCPGKGMAFTPLHEDSWNREKILKRNDSEERSE